MKRSRPCEVILLIQGGEHVVPVAASDASTALQLAVWNVVRTLGGLRPRVAGVRLSDVAMTEEVREDPSIPMRAMGSWVTFETEER